MSSLFPSVRKRICRWIAIYDSQGQRWGSVPRLAAQLALAEIARTGSRNGGVIDPGWGYGRDLRLFRSVFSGLDLSGLDASLPALDCAGLAVPNLRALHTDILKYDHGSEVGRYDIAFSNYFLHLFSDSEATWIMGKMSAIIKPLGRVVASFVSIRERHYGRGVTWAPRCYEVSNGVPRRFRDEEEISKLCRSSGLTIVTLQTFEKVEIVRGQPDVVIGLYLVAKPLA